MSMPLTQAALAQYLEDQLPRYLALLQEWVDINSFTSNPAGVNELGHVTADAFEGLGFSTARVASTTPAFGDHVVLTRPGTGALKIGLVSHLDTVFPAGECSQNAFTWRPEGDRIYGPGTVDIKGGTLVIYMMLEALRRFAPELYESTTWVVLLDASEETLSDDFGNLCLDRLAGAAACLVFEGGFYHEGVFRLVRSRKGMAKYALRVEGKASHAGVAHADGANAIVHLADAITTIAGFTDYARQITYNIGFAHGGTVPNRVPHHAEALGEMRAFDKQVFAEGLGKLIGLAGNGSGCRLEVDILDTTEPWPENSRTDALLQIWSETAGALGFRIFPEARGGLSDGNHTWQQIPTLDGLGPGGGNAHCSEHRPEEGKEQEYLYLPSLVPKTVLNTFAVMRLAALHGS